MCGIAGIFNYTEPHRTVDRPLLERMTRVLAHRGPDGEGFHFDGPVGLGHRRLAIVDLSPTGSQPMSNEDGSCWISYNGELYNHPDFREALKGRHTFRGSSDTETLLHLLEEKGPEALRDAAGIFALAFWNGRERTLTLARDPLGVKQLYYYDDGRRLLFASEIKALLACEEVPRELDAEALNQYLHFHTPLFERTFFKDIRQLRAGEYVQYGLKGVRSKVYWSIDDFTPRGGKPEENVAQLQAQLGQVVSQQLMSDVPVGSFFSGGIDSTAVAAFAKRAAKPPTCFGVHFSGQGVVDERPYQESAAKALGLRLELITLDGSSFPDDLTRLLYHQDQPVIGAAMVPMYYVSKLASSQVKVCLGGQAADEIFGGYARYALARPWKVASSWFSGRHAVAGAADVAHDQVGGNLWRQMKELRTLRRLISNAAKVGNWRELYFGNFAKVPEASWLRIFGAEELVSRETCRRLFYDTLARSPASDPADKVMHWDMQTYLTGLFQQDDRMSMANSLESRVPLADPRMVRFAFQSGFDLKFRAGATKWILRQAVADVIPAEVLNRRKVGFDTPVEKWMRGPHAGFVREVLLSRCARERGIWNPKGVQALLDRPGDPVWVDMIWKALCVEIWAQTFLDTHTACRTLSAPPEISAPRSKSEARPVRDAVQELRELGLKGTLFRAQWEAKLRSGLVRQLEDLAPRLELPNREGTAADSVGRLQRAAPFPPAEQVHAAMKMPGLVHGDQLAQLERTARSAARGRILCFGRWVGDYGFPIDWHVNPVNGRRWNRGAHWSSVLADERRVGDVKLTWEVARFPQAYHLARAATFNPELRPELAQALAEQIESFIDANPRGLGVHWSSGQEIGLRLMAWIFGASVLGEEAPMVELAPAMLQAAYEGALHIERNFDYASKAVYNNHLISEALALLLAGTLLEGGPEAERWRGRGLQVLEEQADAQVYPDGAYIQQSHNYHRVAMQSYLWAFALMRRKREPIPTAWIRAMERSLDFLVSFQNPTDGRLPNYGSNDGSLPFILSTCDFSDFRPTLQALSAVTREQRLYEPGPWDEEALWFAGPEVLKLPLRRPERRSRSFAFSGQHVMRGADPRSFASFRCGTLRDRFSQIDMLHVDVWWRGLNVLVDPGSYLYNGPDRWHGHFMRTGAHNTVMVDSREQMLPYRRFKNLYWTRAKTWRFEERDDWTACEGEHYGFERHAGACVHRRAVLHAKDDLWIVIDRIAGEGEHALRLHWLGGEFPFQHDEEAGQLRLETPEGPFCVAVLGEQGIPLSGSVVAGGHAPPRGWLSRYFGEKVPVPSLAVEREGTLPLTLVSVLSGGEAEVHVSGETWSVRCGDIEARFRIDEGRFDAVEILRGPASRAASSP